MRKTTSKKSDSPASDAAETPKKTTRAKVKETPSNDATASATTPSKPAAKKKVVKSEATPASAEVKPAPKSAAKTPSVKKEKAATTKKPASKTSETDEIQVKFRPQSVQAPPTRTSEGPKKPAALRSLAELVEEEKSSPRPKKKPTPKPKVVEPEAPVESAPSAERPRDAREQRGQRGRSRRGDRPAMQNGDARIESKPETPSLENLESEVFENDVVVHWRSASETPRSTSRKPKGVEAPAKPSKVAKPIAARKSQSTKAERIPASEIPDEAFENFEDSDIRVSFREASGTPDAKPARGSNRRSKPEATVKTEVPVPEPEPLPVVPARPPIQIPDDAPQVVDRDGLPTLVRNKRVYPPIAFFGSAPDERRAQIVLAEVRRSAEAGIHIHSVLVEFEVDSKSVAQSVAYAGYMLNQVLAIDPEAQVVFRVVFAASRGWESQFPDAVFTTQAGRTAEPSVADDGFWSLAQECLVEFVKGLRALDQRDHVLGVHLDRGEWFFPEGTGYDNSKAATHAFRDWLRTRYVNDPVAFRAAWFDGQVQFANVQIPEFRQSEEGDRFMRTNRKDRRWVDYHLFLSDATFSRIADLAYASKEASEGYCLVGVSYGYTFEWSHPASGHLSLGKLLRCRDVDFVAGPPSYRSREPGGVAPFPSPIDSFALNGKLYFSEEDFKTAIGDYKEPDDYNPVIRTPQALEAVHLRGAGAALAHNSGMMWMDLWGNGWLNTHTIWERGSRVRECLTTRMAAPQTAPDVAVFIDERALAYLSDQQSFALLVQDVRESVLRSGLSAGFYLLSDLAHRETFPECKLYIFLNAWDIRPEHRLAIKNRLQQDNKVLFWLYCAGMFDNGRESLERAREITGIAIKPQPFHSKTGTTILNRRHPLCEAFSGQGLIGGAHVDPSYFAIPENALVLGEYSQSGLPSFVVREFNEDPDPSKHWKSVFLGEPFVTPGLLRGLAQIAGCHIWNYHSDVVHARPPFLAVHATGGGARTLALPRNWEAYNLVTHQWETEDKNNIRFQAMDGSTHLFLVGERHEIEHLLNIDPNEVLTMEELPERKEEHAQNAAMFDVPIMRLDAFFEGSPDEAGEEWFLRPGMMDVDDAPSEQADREDEVKVGRRRRKRSDQRRTQDRNATGTAFDDEVGMNIMFRKRD